MQEQQISIFTAEQVLKMFHISRPTLCRWNKSVLKPIKIGRRVYYKETDVRQLINTL